MRSAAEVSTPRFDAGGWLFDTNLQPTPLANAGGFDSEDVLLAELVEKSGGGSDSLDKVGREDQLPSCPFRQVAQIRTVRRRGSASSTAAAPASP